MVVDKSEGENRIMIVCFAWFLISCAVTPSGKEYIVISYLIFLVLCIRFVFGSYCVPSMFNVFLCAKAVLLRFLIYFLLLINKTKY